MSDNAIPYTLPLPSPLTLEKSYRGQAPLVLKKLWKVCSFWDDKPASNLLPVVLCNISLTFVAFN